MERTLNFENAKNESTIKGLARAIREVKKAKEVALKNEAELTQIEAELTQIEAELTQIEAETEVETKEIFELYSEKFNIPARS